MPRDQLYDQIILSLEGKLDPELFEECASDLLRSIYPTLVPIQGGSDAGMDGAIADYLGEPFPLIVTTSTDVIGNLTQNLESYIEQGRHRRRVVLATSRSLSPLQIRNLYNRASELGFNLVNVHEQRAIANLLYHNPVWTRTLLGLTGNPPALSVLPRSDRPLLTHKLIGRQDDFTWLCETPGDRLIVGQPGIGKTYLLRNLVLSANALFVVSNDRAEIATNLRLEQPEILIVDDAHIHRELLSDLIHTREELGANFSIIASTWPGDQELITQTLNLPRSQVLLIDRMVRDDIVEVVIFAGIRHPQELIREIVNQAEGRPGLAVTLTHLCLQGDVQDIASGEALRSSISKSFESFVGEHASYLLAAFSVGGDAGISTHVVAQELEINLLDLHEAVTKLAAGGVILDAGQHRLAVRPPALRHALIRDVFYSGAISLPIIDNLIAQVPDFAQCAETLIGAKARGAAIPRTLIENLLEQTDSNSAWVLYASMGHDESKWALEKRPGLLNAVAPFALNYFPETAIPMLLETAVGDHRMLNASPDHPLRLIEDWAKSATPGTGEVYTRRRAIIEAALTWLQQGQDLAIGLSSLQSALSPEYSAITSDPGAGTKITFHSGYISLEDMHSVYELWQRVLDLIDTLEIEDWSSLRDILEEWAYKRVASVSLPQEVYDTKRDLAAKMLRGFLFKIPNRPSINSWGKQVASYLNQDINLPSDPDFEIIYPAEEYETYEEVKAAEPDQSSAVRNLAERWSKEDALMIGERLSLYEKEANIAGLGWPRWAPSLCQEICRRVDAALVWAKTLIDLNCSPDLVSPFISKAIENDETGWVDLVNKCLEHSIYRGLSISLVLTSVNIPDKLLSKTLDSLEGASRIIDLLIVRKQLSEEMTMRLLTHNDTTIASAAAYGEWAAEPRGNVRDSLQSEWRSAVINASEESFWLQEILKTDPAIAFEWLQQQIPLGSLGSISMKKSYAAGISVLDMERRKKLLAQVPNTLNSARFVSTLVGMDPTLYKELLQMDLQKDLHLAPLSGYPEGEWVEMAKLALEVGYSVEDVAGSAYGYPLMVVSWSGKASAKWQEWKNRFEQLFEHEDEQIRAVSEAGKAIAEARLQNALEEERNEEIYGLSWRN